MKDVIEKDIIELNKSSYRYTDFIRGYSEAIVKYKKDFTNSYDHVKICKSVS